jgi:hypothetical protein
MFNPPEAQIFGGPRDRSYPSPIELLHISIFHTGPGIDELVHFYQVALNMRFVFKTSYPTFEFIAISPDDENHRLGFVNALTDDPPGGVAAPGGVMKLEAGVEPRHAPQRPCRIEHTSWLYRDFEAVLLTAKRIKEELGLWPRTTRHGGHDLTIDYDDPDGNRVEMLSQHKTQNEILFSIYKGAMGTPDEKRAYADSYMMMDMEKLLGLYETGTPIEKLTDRAFCRAMREEGRL